MMNRDSMARNAAIGIVAGTAIGAVGAYMVQKKPRQMKKIMKKANIAADKAMMIVDAFMR